MHKNQITVYLFSALFLVFLRCALDVTNPVSSNYEGDYKFEITTELENENGTIFTPYTIIVNNLGEDQFLHFLLTTEKNGVLKKDTISLNDSATVTFVKEYDGQLKVTGVRPNDKTLTETIDISIINSIFISGPDSSSRSVSSDTGKIEFFVNFSEESELSDMFIDWYVNDSLAQNLKITQPFTFYAEEEGDFTIVAKFSDYDLIITNTLSVRKNQPVLTCRDKRIVSMPGQTITLTAPFEIEEGTPHLYHWENKSGNIDTTTTTDTLFIVFDDPGEYKIDVWFSEENNVNSQACVIEVVINQPGIPVIESIKIDAPDSIFVHSKSKINIEASDKDGSVEWLYMARDTTRESVLDSIKTTGETVDTFFVHIFEEYDVNELYFWVIDDESNRSRIEKREFNVRKGKPVIDTAWIERDTIFRGDKVKLHVSAISINGTVEEIRVDLAQNDAQIQKVSDSVFTIVPQSDGICTLIVYAVDEHGFESLKDTTLLTVLPADPRIDSLRLVTPADTLFAGEKLLVVLSASDPDNLLDSVTVWISKDGEERRRTREVLENSAEVEFHFRTVSDTGKWVISAKAVNSKGYESEVKRDSVLVEPGYPVIRSIKPDIPVWVLDPVEIVIDAYDNSEVERYWVSIDGGTTWKESESGTNSVLLENGFPLTEDDTTYLDVLVRVRDDMGLEAEREFKLEVLLGVPKLEGFVSGAGAEKDTFFVVVDTGAGTYPLHELGARALVGEIEQYYWSFEESFDTSVAQSSSDPVIEIDVADSVINDKAATMWIYARDSRGILGGGEFVVVADSVPPAPSHFDREIVENSVVLKWNAVQDAYDGPDTRVQIYVKEGISGEPDRALFDEDNLPTLGDGTFGTETVAGYDYFTYKFEASFTGPGRWRVVLEDARGSRTPGTDVVSLTAP
ncbi:hypothetical protein QA601_05765 [Chitinispirillales bacterium ANBcel5]|uniref:hypothetical protein n=1 Tax=Cellulosispirillum alkaliphilum TaxID=3039283 RepID=UPI002A4F4615|nr:hypothetical protein [Chitinispirillales bacterium ANBcel5]